MEFEPPSSMIQPLGLSFTELKFGVKHPEGWVKTQHHTTQPHIIQIDTKSHIAH